MNKMIFKIPTRKKPKSARFIIGASDPNKKQTLPRGYDGRGYAAGVGDTNVVGSPVSAGGDTGSAIVASIDTPDPVLVTPPQPNNDATATPYKYGCAMLSISDALSEWLFNWVKENIPESDLYSDPDQGIDGCERDHHISMLYGIHEDDPNKLHQHFIDMLDCIPEISLGNISCFSDNPNYDVINVSIDSDLNTIHDSLSRNIEHTKVFDTFTPHITLAYTKKNACQHLCGDKAFNGMKDKPSETIFSNRYGEQYRYASMNNSNLVALG
jgi:hypothetical protein